MRMDHQPTSFRSTRPRPTWIPLRRTCGSRWPSCRPPAIDTAAAMYQPRKRAKREHAPLTIAPAKAARNGSHEEKQAWMRGRQSSYPALQLREANDTQGTREKRITAENQRMAELEGRRETELLAEAQSDVQRRHTQSGPL